jgi:hypothetical protein
VSLIHLVPSSYIVSLQNCMNEGRVWVLDVDTTIKPLYGEQEGAELGYNPHKVVVCCQWTPETTGLFDSRRFAAMKLGSVLVNFARGEIIDEDALAEALEQDCLRGVVLDVYKRRASCSMLRRPGSGSIRGC